MVHAVLGPVPLISVVEAYAVAGKASAESEFVEAFVQEVCGGRPRETDPSQEDATHERPPSDLHTAANKVLSVLVAGHPHGASHVQGPQGRPAGAGAQSRPPSQGDLVALRAQSQRRPKVLHRKRHGGGPHLRAGPQVHGPDHVSGVRDSHSDGLHRPSHRKACDLPSEPCGGHIGRGGISARKMAQVGRVLRPVPGSPAGCGVLHEGQADSRDAAHPLRAPAHRPEAVDRTDRLGGAEALIARAEAVARHERRMVEDRPGLVAAGPESAAQRHCPGAGGEHQRQRPRIGTAADARFAL